MSEGDSTNTKSAPNSSLKNVTNITRRYRTQNCEVKMEQIKLQPEKKSTSEEKEIKSAKTNKRKASKSDQDIAKKKKPLAPVQSKPGTTETPENPEHSVKNVLRKYEQLQKVISKKYVNVVERLKLDYIPLCCENLEYCHTNHYKRAPAPKQPSTKQMNLIRNSLQQARYNVFISLVGILCHKKQFPGDVILTNIVKLLLTLNPESECNASLQSIIDQLLCLFDVILKTFPPCWLALRESYIRFLRNTMEMSSLFPNKQLNAKNTIFEIVIMLLEDNLDEINRSSKKRNGSTSTLASTSSSSSYLAHDNEFHNMQHWEKNDTDAQTFSALSRPTRVERLMQVLHFLAKMLEMDMAMWMLRYHKNPSKHIHNSSDQPLVIELFSLSVYKGSSVVFKKVISLFSICVEKNLSSTYLNIMDRFISLLANVQNLCEIENTSNGIKYPFIGPRTSTFAIDLYKTAEVNMKTSVSLYIRLIRHLRCPFVRCEYIDTFLKRLNPAAGKMNPQKIFENFRKNRWLECVPDEERPLDESFSKQKSIIYRQDYLELILEALRSYCDYFAIKKFFQEILHSTSIENTNTDNREEGDSNRKPEIDLSTICKNLSEQESMVHTMVVSRDEKAVLPILNMAVSAELLAQYRNDLKFCTNLYLYIRALQDEHNEDFSQMIEFLKDFAPT